MSGSQVSRSAALLRQFSRFATSSSASSTPAAAVNLGAAAPGSSASFASFLPLRGQPAKCSGLFALLGDSCPATCRAWQPHAPSLLRRFFTDAACKSSSGSGAGAAAAAASERVLSRQGMLMAAGVWGSRAAAGVGAAAAASSSSRSSAGGISLLRRCAGLVSGRRQGGRTGALLGPLRLKSTAAAAVTEQVAAAAGAAAVYARRRYGGAALSAGLSDGARLGVAAWLGVCSLWVYSMVVLGGITRLTRSGLSMTEWKLAGERPPWSEEDWLAEFAKYKASPEFQKIHRGMTLEEFKFIYWMEYAHRMWGRFLGLAFALPATYFLARGWVTRALGRRLALLFFMGGTQGLVGWWMVRSGLEEPEHEWAAPRVSPYRLAAHLVSAFAIYATLVWTTLDLLYPHPATVGAAESVVRSTAAARRRLLPLAALIAVTATSGAFVAGMDAGRAYNTWPLMGGRVVPEEYWDERLRLSPVRNLFENTAAVQFNHRTLATSTLAAVGAAWLAYRGGALPGRATTCLHLVAGITAAQFALGVYTLLQYVPVHLGSAHQANALNLFTAVLALLHAARLPAPGPASAVAAPLVTPAAAALVGCVGYLVVTQNGTLTQSKRYTGPSAGPAEAEAPVSGSAGK